MISVLFERIKELIGVIESYVNIKKQSFLHIYCQNQSISFMLIDDNEQEEILNMQFKSSEQSIYEKFILTIILITYKGRKFISEKGVITNPFTNPKVKIIINDLDTLTKIKEYLAKDITINDVNKKHLLTKTRQQKELARQVQVLTVIARNALK